MTNVNQNVERAFFVTHVYANGPYLNICGQFDRDGSRLIESLIRILKDSFDKAIGAVTSQTILIPNSVCCAFHEDNYYRAKIIKVQPDSNVVLQFIDYGNFEVVHPSHIRLLDCHDTGLKLQSLPPIAFEFPLPKVMPFNNAWSRCIIEHVRHILRYNEHPVVVTTFGNRQIFTLYYNGQEFSDFLIRSQMALPTPTEQLQSIRLSSNIPILKQQILSMPYRPPSQEGPTELPSNNNYMVKHRPAKLVASPKIDHTENWRKPQEITQMSRPQPAISPRSQDIPTFKSRVLEKGSTHKVIVSDVDDGPLKFSIQLESCAQELETLMKSINNLPLKSLSEPPIPSSACLGRCSKDKTLRRAVVSTANDLQAKVFYVDFGNQETLAHTDIYEIPAQYANPPLLSVRFMLSGARDLSVTTEMKEHFKDLVLGKSLLLKVVPVEDSPLIHYGILYYNDKSVLDMLREAFPDSAIKFPDPLRLSAGSRENVHVSYIEACNKFFVQLDKNILELDSLTNLLTECVKVAPPIKPAHIKPGLKCLAHCGVDSQWYRAEVIQVVENHVTVHYVDYGNDETIPSNAIRSIRNDDVTKIPILAIQCILNGFESLPFNKEVHEKFELSVLDKPLVMNVMEEQRSAIIVDLYDVNTKPIVNISSMLQNPDESKVQQSQPITHWHEQESDVSSKTLRGKSEESDRWTSKKQNESSEATFENSSYEEVKIKNWKNTENEEKRFNNREQKSNREWNNSQGDRFNRENSRNDRFNRDSGSRYDRNDRNDTNNRFDNENSPNNRYRDKSNGRRGYSSSDNNRRSDRNSGGENTWSDKDSNASSRSSGRRGRRGSSGRGTPRGGRGGERGGRRDNARSLGRDSEGENDRGFKHNRSNDRDFNKSGGSRFKGDNRSDNRRNDRNDRNDRYQSDRNNTWNTPAVITTDFSSTSLQIPPPNITIGAVKHCEVVFSTNPTDFYVQLIPDNKELDSVMEKIAGIYETGGVNLSEFNSKVGMNCIAQYSEDLKWYRAVIIQICDSTGAMVRFVDYGNTEVVSFGKIKEIESEFIKLPTQAVHVKLLAASKDNWENSEIERFTTLTEMKTLEAEFVALENDIYEVLLREIVDNNSQNPYFNEEFSGGADLMQAKETAKNKNKSTRPTSSTQTLSDYASLDQKWAEPTINLGGTEDIMVTWITNPNDFYCQLLGGQTAFRSMMNEIQTVYTGRQPTTDNLQVGFSVIATFIDDGAFYRAEVIDIKPGGRVVRFIDYGNCAMIQPHEVFCVEKRFMDLPKQAIPCLLKNIAPLNGNSWSKANVQEIDNIFNVDKLQCSFLEMKNNKYNVSLTSYQHYGADLARMMVEKGLASYEECSYDQFQRFQGTNVPELDGDHMGLKGDLTKVDISYLEGQVLRVKVSNVESVQKFHVQLPSVLESEKMISDFMATQDPQVMLKLLPEEVCLGTGCLIHSERGWKRATVIDCSRKTDFDVRFIDTGEIRVISLNYMLALPGQLTGIQNQAVECCLKNVISSTTIDEQLKRLVENKEAIIRVDSLKRNILVVDLFDESGHKIVLTNEQEIENISPLCLMPIFYGVHRVSVTHINHSRSVWLKRLADLDTDADLLSALFEYYSISGQTLAIEEQKLCAALSLDGNWYRARIIKKTDSGALIQYIDYGNTENVYFSSLKELEPQFFKPFQLGIEVSLGFMIRGTEAEQQEVLNSHLLNKEFYTTMHKKNGKWYAILGVNPGSKIDEDLSLQDLIVNDENILEATELNEPDDLKIGNEYKIILSHADNPTQFWIQRVKNMAAINELSMKLQEEISSYPPIKGVPEEKLLCAVFNSEKRLWCRAEVIDADEEMATVRFVDYGNTDVVIGTSEEDKIKHLPDSMKAIGWWATKCRLNVVPVDFEDWLGDACSAFTSKVAASSDLKAVFIADSNPKRVELYSGNECISDWLVKEGYASKIGANENVIDELVELELDPKSAFVSHINSPNEFWVQEEKSVADLELIADRFLVAEMFSKVDKVEIGNLYVAKYPEDSSWYRARVISHGNEGTNVLYVDYGNSAMSTEIRAIPGDVAAIPPLSRKCRLVLPAGIKEWSQEACQEFIKMADDGATIFFLDVVEDGETSVVTLTLNGDDIVNQLKAFCEKSEIVDPAPSENSKVVMISHINSPNEFWVHEKASLSDIDNMIEKLIHAGDFPQVEEIKEGLLCVAEFPEDSSWYRAQVLSHGDTGTNVMYIDYGNTAISTEIRKIPKDLAAIPPLAKKCSLSLPEGIDQWSDEACQEFYKQSNDGATEFLMTILRETEMSVVKLLIEIINKDVSDYLAEFSEKQVPEVQVIEERLSPLGEENSPNVVVSYVVSPTEFWTQAESKIVDLEEMANHLIHAENFLTLSGFEKGTICAAKFPEDGEWYRAKILSHGDGGTEVLYIDYGNSAVSSEIRALPEDIIKIPPLSRLCCLKMPKNVESWSKKACEKFIELVADGATMFEFKEIEELGENSTFISLLYNGQDVVEILEPLCKKVDPTEAETKIEILEPLCKEIDSNETDMTQTDAEQYRVEEQVIEYQNNEQFTSIQTTEIIPPITKAEVLELLCKEIDPNETDMTQTDAEESRVAKKSAEYHNNEQFTSIQTTEVIPPITKTKILDPLSSDFDPNGTNLTQTDAEESRVAEKSAEHQSNEQLTPNETADIIPQITKPEMDSTDDAICDKHVEEHDKSNSTSGVDVFISSDNSSSSDTFGKLEPSPKIMNSTLIPPNEVVDNVIIADNVTFSDKNDDVDDTIIILDSTVEDTVELSQTTVDESTKDPEEKHQEDSICHAPAIKEDNAAPENMTEGVVADEDNVGDSAKCGLKKPENSKIEMNVVDNSNSKNTTEETLSCPTTPKTPHSEKFVAGVVTDHRIFEADDDEIIEVEVIKKDP